MSVSGTPPSERPVVDVREGAAPVGVPANEPVEPSYESWELHSELVLVCPDLRARARELMSGCPRSVQAERSSRLVPAAARAAPRARPSGLASALAVYTVAKALRMAATALAAVGLAVAITLLVSLVARL